MRELVPVRPEGSNLLCVFHIGILLPSLEN